MPISKYFWPRTFLSNEGIVPRNLSIAIQSQDLPEIAAQILRRIAINETARDGHQKCPIRQKNHSTAGMLRNITSPPLKVASSISPEKRPGDSALWYLR